MNNAMEEKIKKTIESVRPFLQADSGDVELVEVSEDGIVKVRFIGDCENCPMSTMTLRAGIERALLKAIPQIRRIESVN